MKKFLRSQSDESAEASELKLRTQGTPVKTRRSRSVNGCVLLRCLPYKKTEGKERAYSMANRVRKCSMNFYVDEDERAAIKLKMQKMGMNNQSVYLRKMALEGRIIKVDYSVFDDISKNIDGISRNINQIAKRVNATNNAYEEDMVQIKKRQEEVWQLLKSILSQLL